MDLIQELLKKKVLNKKQAQRLNAEAEKTGKTQEELLLEQNLIEEQELFVLKSRLLGVPFKRTLPEIIPPDLLSVIPKESVEYYKTIPLGINREERTLEVGMVYPEDPQAQQALKFLARQEELSLRVYLITLSDFNKYIKRFTAPEKEMEKALEKLEAEMGKRRAGVEEEELMMEPERAGRLVEEAPIIKMVAVTLRQAVEARASDVHIEPTRTNLKVRFRIDGILRSSLLLPLKVHPAIVARIKILSGLKIDETRLPQDGRFSTRTGGEAIDFRVSTFPTTLGEKVVVRVLDPGKGVKSLKDLGLQGSNLKVMEGVMKKAAGMVLITGPTGCGKTTTLYTLMGLINKEKMNIVTLEDPVEYFIDGINQSQVKPEIGYTFAKGLRQILRQDPDVIMVGEIRDEETANLAIHAALTGHLVLSTLHTTNVTGVIPRLIDMQIRPFLLPPTLSLAANQRLVRVLCSECKQKIVAPRESKEYILKKIKAMPPEVQKQLDIKEPIYVFRPKGCKKCNFGGYSGRIGIFEVMKMTDNLAKIIIQSPTEAEILKEARMQGMSTMQEDGILKVLQGVTSLEEVMRVSEEK